MKLAIRSRSQEVERGVSSAKDAQGLLFYYLYDDWYATYGLVAREEHQYGAKLEEIVSKLVLLGLLAKVVVEDQNV